MSIAQRYPASKRIETHLGQTGGEYDNLVYPPHLGQKLVHPRPLDDVDIVHLGFDFNGDNIVGRGEQLWG